MYSNLTTAVPITEAQIPQFYKDATFGVPAGDVASSESPEPGVTIERDSGFGVPHIYGDTRAELMFGIGYATAEDRLFFIDVLRHSGQGDLAQFAGGSNVAMDEDVWSNEPYTQQDLVNQINWAASSSPDGPQILSDATNYVDGINAYIAKAESPLGALTMMPAEYAAIGQPDGPGAVHGRGPRLDRDAGRRDLRQRWRPAAVERGPVREHGPEIRARALHGGGVAGAERATGQEEEEGEAGEAQGEDQAEDGSRSRAWRRSPARTSPRSPRTRRAGKAALGAGKISKDDSGFATFMSFDDPNDPEAPTTVHGKSFPYQTLPRPSKAVQNTIALPDPGSVSVREPGHGRRGPGRRERPGHDRVEDPTVLERRWPGWRRAPGRACSSSRARCRTRCSSAPPTAPAAIRSR